MSDAMKLRPRSRKPDRASHETWALLTLALMGLLTLAWIGFFAWLNARAVGLL
jgi:hypothetical protein